MFAVEERAKNIKGVRLSPRPENMPVERLYKKRKGRPNRYISRYTQDGSIRDEGVLMRRRILFPAIRPNTIRKEKHTVVAIIHVETELFSFLYSLAPNSFDTRTEAPMLQPKAKAIKMRVIS